MSLVHGIPAVFWVREVDNREEAVSWVSVFLANVEGGVPGVVGPVMGVSLPNDMNEEEDWHLAWVRGPAPEVVSEDWEFDKTTGQLRRLDNG